MAASTVSPSISQGSQTGPAVEIGPKPANVFDGCESTGKNSNQRVQYILEYYCTNTKWYVIFDKVNGQESFRSQEAWEQGEWREHKPSERELAAARELMAQKKGAANWEQTISMDDSVVSVITDLGKFPACVRAAIHEFRDLHVDSTEQQHLEFAGELRQHVKKGEQYIAQLYKWFEQHRYYRSVAERLQMKKPAG